MVGAVLRTFANFSEMKLALADDIEHTLKDAINTNGRASFVATGGRTAPPLLSELSRRDLEWQNVDISLTDDRWESADPDRTNHSIIRANLLVDRAQSARFLPLKHSNLSIEKSANIANENIELISKPFDVMLLGMGLDLHVGSLIPDAVKLKPSDNQWVCTLDVPANDRSNDWRISLTLEAMLTSRQVYVMLAGPEKLKAFKTGMLTDDISQYPGAAILQNTEIPVTIYWSREVPTS